MRFPVRTVLAKALPVAAIDLGTTVTRIWVSGADEAVSVPSAIVMDDQNHLVAVGQPALDIAERSASGSHAVRPIRQGIVDDVPAARLLVRSALAQQQQYLRWRLPPLLMATIPYNATTVQQERTHQLLESLGARGTYLIPQPLAAAIGSGIPMSDLAGSLIVQLGGGIVEAAALTLGGILAAASTDFAGRSLAEQLRSDLKSRFALEISSQDGMRLLNKIVLNHQLSQHVRITGKQTASQEPASMTIDVQELIPGLLKLADRYVTLVRSVLRQVPPAVTGDLLDRGILLSGGVAQLTGLSAYLTAQLQLPCSVVDKPESAAIRGALLAITNLDTFALNSVQ